jgi:hypothetical protein
LLGKICFKAIVCKSFDVDVDVDDDAYRTQAQVRFVKSRLRDGLPLQKFALGESRSADSYWSPDTGKMRPQAFHNPIALTLAMIRTDGIGV